jgi:urease accessory protein
MRLLRAAALLVLVSSPAYAHHAEWMRGEPFVQGLSMPVHGLDHLVVAFAVGLVAAEIGGLALAAVPALFAALVAVGGLLNVHGIAVPFVEQAILGSTFALGAMLVARQRLPAWLALLAVALVAAVQGGALIAAPSDPPPGWSLGWFVAGCLLSASLVTALGAASGLLARRTGAALRYAGPAVAALGTLAYFVPAANEIVIRVLE